MNVTRHGKATVAVGGAALLLAAGGITWGVLAWTGRHEAAAAVPQEFSVDALKANRGNPERAVRTLRDFFGREDLTEAQRDAVFQNMHTVMEQSMGENIDEFYAAAPADKNTVLDRHIDEWQKFMEAMRKHRAEFEEQRRKWEERQREQNGQGDGGTGGSQGDGGDGERRGNDARPGGGPGPGGGARGRGFFRGERFRTREGRKEASESRDPDKTARRMAYFSAMMGRMQARGIEMPRFGRDDGQQRNERRQ